MTTRVAILAVVVAVGGTQGAVLCVRRSGSLTAREQCLRNETVVDPVTLGLQGPPGECLCPMTTTTLASGRCRFSQQSCQSDADCALAGLCNEWGGCTQSCGGGQACPSVTFCFAVAGQGNVCAGCQGDSSRCTVNEICSGDTCTECCAATSTIAAQTGCPNDAARCHPECDTIGKPCTISDPCVH